MSLTDIKKANKEHFTNLKKMRGEYQGFIKKNGRAAILGAIKDLFERFPEIKRIGWSGHTPNWNDGDACIFTLGEVYFDLGDPEVKETKPQIKARLAKNEEAIKNMINELAGDEAPEEEELPEEEDEEEIDMESWSSEGCSKALEKAISAFERDLEDLSDVVESVFGDGHLIVIYNDKKMTVEIQDYYD